MQRYDKGCLRKKDTWIHNEWEKAKKWKLGKFPIVREEIFVKGIEQRNFTLLNLKNKNFLTLL